MSFFSIQLYFYLSLGLRIAIYKLHVTKLCKSQIRIGEARGGEKLKAKLELLEMNEKSQRAQNRNYPVN